MADDSDDAAAGLGALIIGLLLLVLAIYVAVFVLAVVLTAGLISLPGGGCALVSHCVVRAKRLREIRSPAILAQAVSPSFDGTALTWGIDDGAITKLLRLRWTAAIPALSAAAGILLTILVLAVVVAPENAPRAHATPSASGTSSFDAALGFASAVGGVGLALLGTPLLAWFGSFRTLQRSAKKQVDMLADRVNALLREAGVQADRTDEELRSSATVLAIEWPHYASNCLRNFVDRHKVDIVVETRVLDDGARRILDQSRGDGARLAEARDTYMTARAAYDQVVETALCGQASFVFRKLEQLEQGLQAANAVLLPERKWEDYQGVITSILADLQQVQKAIYAYSRGEPAATSADVDAPPGRMTLEEAYKLFGLTDETATEERVKQKYRALAQLYHPDTGADPAGTMFKRVGQALELIKKHKDYI